MSLLDVRADSAPRSADAVARQRTAGIAGLAAALPAHVVDNPEIAARIGVEPEWIVRRTGMHSRHRLAAGETLLGLCRVAGADALARAGVAAEELDAVLVATSSADQLMPHAAPMLAHALGARRAMAWDVGIACTGFLAGLEQGAALVESGRADTVLLVAADALSRLTDHDDRATAALFGDAAGAVVIVADGEWTIGQSIIRADATDADALSIENDDRLVRMDGQLVFQRAITSMESACRQVLDRAGLSVADIDLVVPHQANARITAALIDRLGIDTARVVSNIATVGNTGAASIPLALADAEVPERGRMLFTAFGAGFAYGAMLLWTGT
jgi:3-oxoacyl-[acyl-carrier-protein] synthase-3